MVGDDEIDFSTLDMRSLGPDAHHEIRCRAMRKAHRLRSRYVSSLLVRLSGVVRAGGTGMWRVVRDTWVRWRIAHEKRQAISRLSALDDSALQDIGIRRSEIESVVTGQGGDDTRVCRERKCAA